MARLEDEVVQALLMMRVLLLDEVSMVDDEFWGGIEKIFSTLDSARRRGKSTGKTRQGEHLGKAVEARVRGAFVPARCKRICRTHLRARALAFVGLRACVSLSLSLSPSLVVKQVHIILLGDFKQLPPATSRPPFVVRPSVYEHFRFAVLRENRRVVQSGGARAEELDDFHAVLMDIAHGRATDRVADFVVKAYGKGAMASASRAEFEGSTAVFSKRRYRDAWNRPIVRRLGKMCWHSLAVKARCRATYAKDQRWYGERRAKEIQRRVRAQALWILHLAGDWLHDATSRLGSRKHLMRVMLNSNVALKERFVNGLQCRVLHWHPGHVEKGKALFASHPELLVRIAKESAYASESALVEEVHFMDISARPEVLKGTAGTSMVQVPLQPAYGLTNHKVQSLTIKHTVQGCLEGIFAHGSVYVLASRVDGWNQQS